MGQARPRRDGPPRLLTRYGHAVPSKQKRRKLDQELIELLNELRVALPGVQVLFAFLLIVPFSNRFTAAEKPAYMVALSATVLATALLIAPSAYHRLRWRERDKERMLHIANLLAIAGIAAVAVAMTAAVYLVTQILFDRAVTIVFTVAAAVVLALFWFALPLSTPYDRWDDADDEESEELGSGS
jgi:cation transport ATPase